MTCLRLPKGGRRTSYMLLKAWYLALTTQYQMLDASNVAHAEGVGIFWAMVRGSFVS